MGSGPAPPALEKPMQRPVWLDGQLLKTNFSSGLVVFLVALPLCLGIALASGAPPLAGVISGIVGGLVIGAFSTSHSGVSVPAAGLTAIVLAAMQQLGSFPLFLCAGLIAGAVQLLLGQLRAGSFAEYIPVAVIEGMLAGIGIIIIAKEVPYALGSTAPLSQPLALLAGMHWNALLLALLSLGVLLGWERVPALKKIALLPSALVVVLLGIALNGLLGSLNPDWALTGKQLVQLPADTVENFITLPDWRGFGNGYVWLTGLTIALVASIETLLCIEASDRLDVRRRLTDNNRELRAQGLGNMVCALVGGLPITSVIVRSSANANAGATHKLSTMVHGALLLVCVLTIPAWLNRIPLASLAAVLLLVGYKLAQPATFRHFWEKGWYQFIPFLATLIAVVLLDLLKGVALGLTISIFFILQGNMKRAYYLSREQLATAEEITLNLAEEVSFLNKAAIKKTLKNIPPRATVIINAERSVYIASDVLELLEDFANIYARDNGITVVLQGFKADYDNPDEASQVHVKHSHSI